MTSPRKPWWQQATALVSLGAGGAITGFAFVPGTADQVASPASVPVTLTALDRAAQPAQAAQADDSAVRSAIVSVATYYLRLAQTKTPAEMEALIWQQDSTDQADHGESCAAFASMTLELGAQIVGRQSWVTGGPSYPWPLHDWADVRVDPSSGSLSVISVLQDAEAHQRWHPEGDGYQPLPGDWALFDGHVEVVTNYSDGVLSTIGGDSLPNFSVNAHQYSGSLADDGIAGFVSNGSLPLASGSAGQSASAAGSGTPAAGASGPGTAAQARPAPGAGSGPRTTGQSPVALADIPGTTAAPAAGATAPAPTATLTADGPAIPGLPETAAGGPAASQGGRPPAAASAGGRPAAGSSRGTPAGTTTGTAVASAARGAGQVVTSGPLIPGIPGGTVAASAAEPASSRYQRSQPPAASASASASASGYGTAAQQAFINQIAPGAIAAQHTYGVPAAVTIAQAIDESAWGQSSLAAQDNNLFGVKGTGPAGSVSLPTQEFENGQWVTITAQFRVYSSVAESIADHANLLAASGYYSAAMASRQAPNSFAQALTGVYATDPNYGNTLVGLMRRYNLYRFDPDTQSAAAQARAAAHPASASTTQASAPQTAAGSASQAEIPGLVPPSQPVQAEATSSPSATPRSTVEPSPAASPQVNSPSVTPMAAPTPQSVSTPHPAPTTSAGAARTAYPLAAPTQTTPSRASASAAATTARPTVPAPGPAGGRPAPKPKDTAMAPRLASPRRTAAAAAPVTAAAVPSQAAAPAPASGSGSVGPGPSGSRAAAAPTRTGSPSSSVPHPFATPPAGSSVPSAAPSPSASAAGQDGADIPGIPAGPAGTGAGTAHTSARMSSPSDTRVIAELTAAVRPMRGAGPGGPPAASEPAGAPPWAGDMPAPKAPMASAGAPKKTHKKKAAAKTRSTVPRYQPQLPAAVKSTFLATARKPLARAELIYRDVAGNCGISWKLLAACDWMQCEANPRYSPVQGEKLGTANPDGTVFRTRSEALTQCAQDLIAVVDTVYHIDLTVPVELSVLELAKVFAAFRWGGLLKRHNTSAMEFPYSVQGLTDQHTSMRWPRIAEPHAPDRPGAKFRRPFGAVPVVLSLDYPATV
ncbi:MAG: glucosaminidase domain-containing protein [Streptosporangiaceae bacterium]